MLMKLDHPGIVRVYEYFETPRHLYLVMDLMEGGDLLQSMLDDGCFTEVQARRFFRQILDTVKYTSGLRPIRHRAWVVGQRALEYSLGSRGPSLGCLKWYRTSTT